MTVGRLSFVIRCLLSAIFLTSITSGLESAAGQAQPAAITLRDLLHANNVNDLRQYPQDLLDAPITDEKRTLRFVHLGFHINPSAERLLVLSRDLKFQKELYGWVVATLPDESIVFHHSQIHFAPTHWLELSVFNPTTSKTKQVYPPSQISRSAGTLSSASIGSIRSAARSGSCDTTITWILNCSTLCWWATQW